MILIHLEAWVARVGSRSLVSTFKTAAASLATHVDTLMELGAVVQQAVGDSIQCIVAVLVASDFLVELGITHRFCPPAVASNKSPAQIAKASIRDQSIIASPGIPPQDQYLAIVEASTRDPPIP